MKTVDLTTITTFEKMHDAADVFRLAFEGSTIRCGELEFELIDYKRAHLLRGAQVDALAGENAKLMKRIADLEEALAPAPTAADLVDSCPDRTADPLVAPPQPEAAVDVPAAATAPVDTPATT